MCGIVGILGTSDVAGRLVESLQRLEYRGYDSSGIATIQNGRVDRRRAVGKVAALCDLLDMDPLDGQAGIAHTRWATHGVPNESNAHPHHAGQVAVVHNGIIENYAGLREELIEQGINFASDTDTEVIAQLCNSYLNAGSTPFEAVQQTLQRIHGAFALCFLFEGEDDLMICARQGSPLVVGYGEANEATGRREMFVGSDALALAPMTQTIAYLEEGDMAVLTRSGVDVYDRAFQPVTREARKLKLDAVLVDRGEHRHYMHKEIHEQPATLARAFSNLLNLETSSLNGAVADVSFEGVNRIVLVACGTAYYAASVAKYWFESLANLPVELDIASEFRYRSAPLRADDLAIFVSQSGETADTLAALRHVKGKVKTSLAVINVPTSSIAREADHALEIMAGPEIGVASTKAFSGQLALLAALALKAGKDQGLVDAAQERQLVTGMAGLPRLIAETIEIEPLVQEFATTMTTVRDALFLGRGALAPLALEAALKLKEISYIHAEGYAAGELKHGPIALLDKDVPVVVFAASGPLFEKTMSNVQEVAARGAPVLMVTDPQGAALAQEVGLKTLVVPATAEVLAPFTHTIVAQLLAYHVAVLKGTDVDQPRNLAKSVTVE
ncbi:glutamine--fructose-6-phosphate transaminase (isomerizing) [Tropicibacter sp. Alg240-R139]|uniref:glutamine--fructose-6-phosphate transaminase (isomerizing) n=1 Tax=Tropicibacter sp. Alg240-R139 TaxID=2305991 RepID=UPI0013E0AD11|nr:glutamine--fructose-6-phosphate transaminase (isomerizing) [Tropicibacter sp. Alg240-R139]